MIYKPLWLLLNPVKYNNWVISWLMIREVWKILVWNKFLHQFQDFSLAKNSVLLKKREAKISSITSIKIFRLKCTNNLYFTQILFYYIVNSASNHIMNYRIVNEFIKINLYFLKYVSTFKNIHWNLSIKWYSYLNIHYYPQMSWFHLKLYFIRYQTVLWKHHKQYEHFTFRRIIIFGNINSNKKWRYYNNNYEHVFLWFATSLLES